VNGLDPVALTELQVHESDVGVVTAVLHDRAVDRIRGGDDHHIGLAIDDRGDALGDDRVIVDAENANAGPGHTAIFFTGARGGIVSSIRVPSDSRLTTLNVAPINAARSCMLTMP
jgi:hypothetical protein